VKADAVYPVVRYDTTSKELALGVNLLLLRLGLNAVLRKVSMGSKGRPSYRLQLMGRDDVETFLSTIGAVGERRALEQERLLLRLAGQPKRDTSRDVIPRAAWHSLVQPAMTAVGLTDGELQSAIGTSYRGARLYERNLGRDRARRIADAVESAELERLATSDVYWDEILSIDPDGECDVFDLTVDGLHNFVAENIVSHNSIEQDSDLVCFIYRDEYYNDASDQQGLAEVILAKHRNGPTDSLKLSFLKRYAKFADLAAQ